jgi:hypothetical protein
LNQIVIIAIVATLSGVSFSPAQAQVSSRLDIKFRRQAIRRLVFNHDSVIPLSMLQPSRVVMLDGVPLPDGYPAPCIALTMDRITLLGIGGCTYGALYLYHGFPKNGEREQYEYATGN